MDDQKRAMFSDETKIDRLGSNGRRWSWKLPGEGLSDRLVEGTLKFGGGHLMMWGAMYQEGVGFTCRIEGTMDGELYTTILGHELMKTIDQCGKNPSDTVSSRKVTPSTPAKRPRSGSRTVGLKSYHDQHSHQTSILLNTSGNSSSRGWESTQTPPEGSWSFGRG